MCVWGGGVLGSPPPQPVPLTLLPTPGLRQGQGIRQVDRQAKPLCLFKPPRASHKFNILVRFSLFFQHHKILLIIHYNLMDHHCMCSLLYTKTSLCSARLYYKQTPHKPLPVIFKQRNIISFLKYSGVFFYSS